MGSSIVETNRLVLAAKEPNRWAPAIKEPKRWILTLKEPNRWAPASMESNRWFPKAKAPNRRVPAPKAEFIKQTQGSFGYQLSFSVPRRNQVALLTDCVNPLHLPFLNCVTIATANRSRAHRGLPVYSSGLNSRTP